MTRRFFHHLLRHGQCIRGIPFFSHILKPPSLFDEGNLGSLCQKKSFKDYLIFTKYLKAISNVRTSISFNIRNVKLS